MANIPEHIANDLAGKGWYVGESIFSAELNERLARRVRALAKAQMLQAARVGRNDAVQKDTRLRSDETQWLAGEPEDTDEREAVAAVHALQNHLNVALFLGAGEVELHFARYASGAFYRTHRDRFRDHDARLVSLVFYLNEDWPDEAGGELVLYADDDSGAVITRIHPRTGTMACFLSDRFPHEVLPATQERYSLTGWLRRIQSNRA
jgi:SM-20-related protein